MSDDYQRIEIITGTERRRRWTADEKLRIVEETLEAGESVSAVARGHGVAPNLLYRWRRLMTEGGAVAVRADDGVTGNGEVHPLLERGHSISFRRLLAEGLNQTIVMKSGVSVVFPPFSEIDKIVDHDR